MLYNKGVSPAAEMGFLLEEEDFPAHGAKINRSRKAGNTSPDDNDFRGHLKKKDLQPAALQEEHDENRSNGHGVNSIIRRYGFHAGSSVRT